MKKRKIKKEKRKKSLFIKVLTSIILGFLPSFIFVALFVQYGSLFSNYIKFLSNFNSSWGAWISAIIIGSLVYFVLGAVKSRKNFKKIIRNKFFLVIFLLSILVTLLLIFIQLYLYVNFVLGNDILVKLSADKENLFFVDGLDEDVTFKISVIMNPFCTAQCEYEFFDISSGEKIEIGHFNTFSMLSKSKSYTFSKDKIVQGQILNRFEVSCKSKRTILCYTRERESKRTVLITLNYELSEEDKKFKNESKENIILFGEKLLSIEEKLNKSRSNIYSINYSFSTESFSQQLENLSYSFLQLNKSFKNLKDLWETENFTYLKKELPDFKHKINETYATSEELNSEIISNISLYNNLIENLTNSKKILMDIFQMNLTISLCGELNKTIADFNNVIEQFQKEPSLSDKKILVENIFFEVEEFYEKIQNTAQISESVSLCSLSENITDEDWTKIKIISIDNSFPKIILKEPVPICCFLGQCEKCCDEECSNISYPIIFLHGHNINKALPVDYSFDSFSEIKNGLVSENYIDAGVMVISPILEPKGLWGKVNTPMMVTASYFFDIYKEDNKEKTILSKTEGIDTYAIRLKNIVNLVKYRTNKNKVIIIAQSMGGLVARKYIQIFGGKDIDKAIYVTTPNHGVEGKIKDYCALLGPEVACRDLDKNSLFLNKLNNAPTDIIPTYNIIGIGCSMGDDTGDGVITNSSQYLNYAENYYINGTCNELNFEFLHETILYPHQYPKVYEIIKKILKEE